MEWIRGECLGKGSFGEVFVAIPKDRTLAPIMAVKSAPEDKASSLQNEHKILQRFRGIPGIIQCFDGGFSRDPHRPDGPVNFNLFLELANRGSLSDMIESCGPLPEYFVRICTITLLKTLHLIHSRGYIHCDIKPDNILVFCENGDPENFRLKIADFGLAVETKRIHPRSRNYRGTLNYMPPEVVVLERVSPAMDVWALGCTIVEMLTGNRPWGWLKEKSQVRAEIGWGRHPEIPEWLSTEAKDFLAKCFIGPSLQRFPSEILLFHPFITGDKIRSLTT